MEIHLSTNRKLSACATLQSEIRDKLRHRFTSPIDNCDLSRYYIQRTAILLQSDSEDFTLGVLAMKNRYLEQACEQMKRNLAVKLPKVQEHQQRYERSQPSQETSGSLVNMRKYVKWAENNTGLKVKSEDGGVRLTFNLGGKKECWASVGVKNGKFDLRESSPPLTQTDTLVAQLNSDQDWAAFVKRLRVAFLHPN